MSRVLKTRRPLCPTVVEFGGVKVQLYAFVKVRNPPRTSVVEALVEQLQRPGEVDRARGLLRGQRQHVPVVTQASGLVDASLRVLLSHGLGALRCFHTALDHMR